MLASGAMRGVPALLIAVSSWPLTGCTELVDPGVTYRECDLSSYEENFSKDGDLEGLAERCWRTDNVQDDGNDVFVDDGDLVIRVDSAQGGKRQQWAGGDQGPMAYQTIEGDFIVIARVEALHKETADHCLADDNLAGLVLRQGDTWATFLLGPFKPDGEEPPPGCVEDSDPLRPTQGVVHSRGGLGDDHTERGADQEGIGEDGESDLAICRVDNSITYYYRDPKSPASGAGGAGNRPDWLPMGGTHVVKSGPLDVGATASGSDPNYEAAGHFNWFLFLEGRAADGCKSLDDVALPEEED